MKILTKKKQGELMQLLTNIYLVSSDCIKTLAMLPGGADFIKAEKSIIGDVMQMAYKLEGLLGSRVMMEVNRRHSEMHQRGEMPDLPFGIEFPKDELITIDQAVRVFGDTFPTRKQQMGKFERALRKAYRRERPLNPNTQPQRPFLGSDVMEKAGEMMAESKISGSAEPKTRFSAFTKRSD